MVITRFLVLATAIALCADRADCQDRGALQAVRELLDAGRYEAAEAEAHRLADRLETLPHREQLAVREVELESLLRNGRGAEARTQALAAALVASEPDGEPRSRGAASRRLRGLAFFDAARYGRAATDLEAALRADERALGPSHPDVAIDLEALSLAYMRLERSRAALDASARAVAILEAAGLASEGRLAHALATRAIIRQRAGDYRPAGEDLERALAIRERLGPSHPDTARVLTILGDQLWFTGDPARGRDHLTRALAIAERTLRPDHPDLALTLRYLAMVVDDLGELDRAKGLRERGLRIALAAYPPQHPQVAFQRNDLAISHVRRGEYVEARRLFEQILAGHIERLGAWHPEVASTYHNLGTISASLGDFADAERLQRRAIRLWERTVGPSHPMVPWALVALGSALASQGEHGAAVPILRRALAIRERSLGRDHVQVAQTLTALATSLAALGQPRAGEPLARRAIGIWERAQAPEGLSDGLLVLARIEHGVGDHAAARRDYERAIAVRLPAFGEAHPSIGDARAGLASALAALAQPRDAYTMALDAERIGRDHLRLTAGYLSERQALNYAAARSQGLDLALSLLLRADRMGPALDAVVRGRSVVLDEMAVRQRLRAGAGDATLAPLWSAFARASQRLANLVVAGPGDLAPATYAAVLGAARRERNLAETALADRSGALRREIVDKEVGLHDVQAALPAGSALVSFVRYHRPASADGEPATRGNRTSPAYLAFVARSGDAEPAVIMLGAASPIDGLIARWRRTALEGIGPSGAPLPGAERALRQVGASLRTRIWDPLSPHITGIDRLFIVPDGAIGLVPFAALPVDRSAYVHDAGPALHYLSAERDVVAFREAIRVAPNGLLALGGPTYGPVTAHSTGAVRAARPAGAATSACPAFRDLMFPALPGSLREVEDVGALWRAAAPPPPAGGRPLLVLTANRASEAAFKAASPGYRVLHLATHGFFISDACEPAAQSFRGARPVSARPLPRPGTAQAARPSENPLLLSGLALSGANRRLAARTTVDDGILTAEEVATLDLDGVEWAVLSACDTGLGEIRAGEGIFGLRRAFQIAGARTVIMSLWPVEDRAARAWMRSLYAGRLHQHLSTSDAVRRASSDVLAERRRRGLSTHPLFWAGFVAVGDWR